MGQIAENNVKVSIIIPIYNAEKYIEQCINSVINQTYTNLQIILVNDGSQDRCGELCDLFAEKDSRIQVIHKSNGGVSSARNVGLDAAIGDYIYFVDSDDTISSELVEVCLKKAQEANSDIVVFNYQIVTKGRERKFFFHNKEIYLQDNARRSEFICNRFLNHEIGWECWGRFFDAQLIRKNQLRFVDNNEIFAEDAHFMLQACLHARHISVIEDVLYYYTIREDSIMGGNLHMPLHKYINFVNSLASMFDADDGFSGMYENIKDIVAIRLLNDEVRKISYKQINELFELIDANNAFFSEILKNTSQIEKSYWSSNERILRELLNERVCHREIRGHLFWLKYCIVRRYLAKRKSLL